MKGGRHNQLNFEADRRLLDPTAVSDPRCWITGAQAERLMAGLVGKIQRLRYAPTYRDSGTMDLSDRVIEDERGKLRLRDQD
jgi:hypothetical protein